MCYFQAFVCTAFNYLKLHYKVELHCIFVCVAAPIVPHLFYQPLLELFQFFAFYFTLFYILAIYIHFG